MARGFTHTLKQMEMLKVANKEDWQRFHQVPQLIYKHDPHYIAPLQSDVEHTFNTKKNKILLNGDAACFVLLDDLKRPIGRIAAFIDHERNKSNEYPVGGIGFFECIDEPLAAKRLFEQAEEYLAQWQVKAIDGPINFGERDRFWGLLVKGHGLEPLYQENYQPEYYRAFFEEAGYQAYEQILTFHGIMDQVPIERFSKIAERVRARYGYYSKSMDNGSNIPAFAKYFTQVYNVAFKKNPYFKPIEVQSMIKVFRQLKTIADLKMVVVTFEKEKPIAIAGFIPDINPFLKSFKGKLSWWRIPQLLWRIKTTKQHLLKGIAFGIDPEYQKKGAFAELIHSIYNEHTRTKYSDFYLATIRGHNTLMVKSISNLGVEVERVHLAYRKMLDKNIPLDPFEFMDVVNEGV